MRPELHSSLLTPEERRRAVAAILAAGLRRLRERAALATEAAPKNLAEGAEKPLEPVPGNPLTVHVG